MKSQARLRLRIPPRIDTRDAMLNIGGTAFRCTCRGNVLKPRWCTEHEATEYKCHCGRIYG